MRNDHDAKLRRSLLVTFVGAALIAGPAFRAWADDAWRTTVLEENDSLYFNTDKHYTQGLRLSLLSPELKEAGWADDLFDFAGAIPTVFAEDKTRTRRDSLFLGQSIFTPENLDIKPPNPRDRPYGGWLYAGTSMLQETGNQLENFELDLGVVGPAALGRQTQNDFHQFIGIHQAQGWSSQIQNEPGLVVSYERLWRVPVIDLGDTSHGVENGLDVVPEFGGSAGNVFTYGEAGGLLRIGRHLEADYGQVRIRPSLSGTDYFNPEPLGDDMGYYIFAGAQGRVVGHNIFLDGNTFRQSPSVTRKTFVADLQTGVSMYWSSRVRLDASVVRRTEEFEGQRTPDVIGTVAGAFSW